MKRLLFGFFLVASAVPLLANDDGGDGTVIPSYAELVREGYGPSSQDQAEYLLIRRNGFTAAPKPTQAYYGNGYTIYYAYTPVKIASGEANTIFAFGHPVTYYWHLSPITDPGTNLNNYATLSHEGQSQYYAPGDYIAQHQPAVTTVQPQTAKATPKTAAPSSGAATLPAIGEKPSH
jgi:hypothetical protein